MNDWQDPFSVEDSAARERAARRAEREARRRARLAERVQADGAADGQPAPPAVVAPPERAEPPAEPPAGSEPPEPPPEPPSNPPSAPPPAGPPPHGTPPPAVVHRRRLFAVFGVLGLVFVVLAVIVIARHTGGGSEPVAHPKAAKTIKVTIPEGYRRAQIAESAKKADLRGSYEDASKDVKGFDPAKYGAEKPPNLEGFLFPATYELFKNAKACNLVGKQLDAFKQNIADVDMDYGQSKNLTTYDVLIIASMVQAEAGNEGEEDQIAEVIYNRLSEGIPLGIDATIRYATDNYTKPLSTSELAIASPYNTRLNAGLPPTPIGNPGLAAIEASANPDRGDLRYFVAKPGTCGHAFFSSQADFNAAVERYNAAREAAGGKSPTSC